MSETPEGFTRQGASRGWLLCRDASVKARMKALEQAKQEFKDRIEALERMLANERPDSDT